VLFSVLTLLAKVPHGVILFVFSFLYLIVLLIFKSLRIREILTPIVFVLAGSLLVGFVFLRPSPWQDRAFSFPVNSANLAVNSAWYPTIPVLLVAVFALTRFPFLSIPIWRFLSVDSKAFLFSALGAGVISLLRFAVFGATSESYFLNMGLLLGSLASGICLGTYWDTLSPLGKKILCFAFCLSILTYSIVLLQIQSSSTTAPLIMFPLVISLVSGLSIFLLRGFRSYSFSRVFMALVLSFGLLGASVAVHLTTKFESDSIRFSSDVVALDELDALNWLRKNSDANQLLATNRNLCGDDAACILNETHQVISAFTGRAVLIEGPRFLNGARNYPDWAQYRINTSLEFAQSPSSQSARLLKIQGVDLYYLVKAGTKVDHNNVRFLESAHLVYENSAIAIYDLARL
jgi:cell shape-determining protein MreD